MDCVSETDGKCSKAIAVIVRATKRMPTVSKKRYGIKAVAYFSPLVDSSRHARDIAAKQICEELAAEGISDDAVAKDSDEFAMKHHTAFIELKIRY